MFELDLESEFPKIFEIFSKGKSLGCSIGNDPNDAIKMFKSNNPEWATVPLRAELSW